MVTKVEDRTVIEQFLQTRSEEAFCALFEAVCLRVRRYFLLRGLDVSTAEELTQNVLLKTWRRAGELRDAGRFYGWLFAIARNEMVSWWRAQRSHIETVELEEVPPAICLIEQEILSSLRMVEWLRALDPAERDLVLLRFVEGLSYEELAETFQLPLGTIKWRIFSARKKLAQIIHTLPAGKTLQGIN